MQAAQPFAFMIQSVVALQKDAFKIRWFSVPIVRLGVVQMSLFMVSCLFFAWILAPTTRTDDGRRRQRTTTTADDDDKRRRQTITTDGRQPTVPSLGGCSLASVVVRRRPRPFSHLFFAFLSSSSEPDRRHRHLHHQILYPNKKRAHGTSSSPPLVGDMIKTDVT